MDKVFATNRANWDDRVAIHLRDTTGMYAYDAVRDGKDMLGPIESSELGDVAGKSLLHLQCHFGMDTVCLARRGARTTGLDFSAKAIAAARQLASRSGVDVGFVEGNVINAPEVAGTGYDIVYTTWGTVGWLPNVRHWAKAVSDCLAPGGYLYMADGHPTLFMVEEKEGRPEFVFDWRTPEHEPVLEEVKQSYAGDGTDIEHYQTCEWNHPLSDIIGALLDAGLTLEFLREHDRIPWQALPSMVQGDDGMFRQRQEQVRLPLAFSLRAAKPAEA